jgi:alkylation response protein AidB-like acyl-CoA dehydrogenase
MAMFAGELLGMRAVVEEGASPANRWVKRLIGAREFTIAGGTSEIQRNIIAERVLKLPKG